MRRHLPTLALVLLAQVGAATAPAAAESVLVQYGFDRDTPTGPDTVRVFQNARGHVRLSSEFRYSGYGSVELRDVPGDRDFPELQGYFPVTRDGRLYLQLALMTPDARQELNIALAGPRGFRLGKDGIAFWLSTRDGWLFHTSDSIPKRLFELEPFAWYLITAAYDVEAGRYDLWVEHEGENEPFITKLDQPNAASQGASAVHLFSFIGDNGDDLSSVVYFVDDVIVARSRPAELPGFVAPGRRNFFVELLAEKPVDLLKACPAVHALEEIGITDRSALSEEDWQLLGDLLEGSLQAGVSPALEVAAAWRAGCSLLEAGRFRAALDAFERGLAKDHDAVALVLGSGLALAGLGRYEELERRLERLAGLGSAQDPRVLHLQALAIAGSREIEAAIDWLAASAREALLQSEPDHLADAYFTLLRLAGRFVEAYDYAHGMAGGLEPKSADASRWFERAGQAAFALEDLAGARRAFESALPGADSSRALLALADIAFLEGDVEQERRLRERIYGRLSFDSPAR